MENYLQRLEDTEAMFGGAQIIGDVQTNGTERLDQLGKNWHHLNIKTYKLNCRIHLKKHL